MLKRLQEKNPRLRFFIADDKNPLYKKIDIDFSDMLALAEKLPQQEVNRYIPDDCKALALASTQEVVIEVFAELPIQAGWCFGGNRMMNAMEWHKSSEIVVACTDCVLLLGRHKDIEDDCYDSAKCIALYLNEGEAVELLPMTLHFAPLPVQQFFKAGIILLKGTNAPLTNGICGTRFAQNKWMLVHKDYRNAVEAGGKIGVIGENITLNA